MDLSFIPFERLPFGAVLAAQPLLALALLAIALSIIGGVVGRIAPAPGAAMRMMGSLGLAGVLVLTIVDVARLNPELDLALPQLGLPKQIVEGDETRVPLGRDGHYWLEATVNGHPERFLVDTGASLTAIAPETALAGGIAKASLRGTIALRTANGAAPAQLASIGELRAGNIVARDLDAVVAPSMQGMNVIGMNFLSRLDSWRVEDGVLILVPHHPQPAATG
ncbi:TIGR02281 family clan AA aspartic protease [Croceicoccus sp. F390]|uniref:TIGR02281 family clan AA aspartic protease n=1 Tax=Croceicoccus esteveae TaxID=3075597 RepID=A0ABU2ZEH2_9SPHN|nr:TIGR02281 family clan AA aspartic protease [Croceicoccus sp. F390]MDT0575004.1 TIGR02281 family clan AA aspartic protease [Croceicoccus sp. F390]